MSSAPKVHSDNKATFAGSPERNLYFIIGLMSFCWLLFCCRVTFIRWENWDLGIDTGFWAQLLHRHSQGMGWTTTVMYEELLVLFKFHIHMLLYPLALIYKIFPHPTTMNVVQHLAHSAGAFLFGILVFRLCDKNIYISSAATAIYLLFPQFALAQTTYDFSFRHLATFFIPLIALTALSGHKKTTLLLLAIFTSGSDELGLSAGFILFSLAWIYPENRKFYAVSGVVFIVYTMLLLKYGIAHHAMGRYSHFSQGLMAILSSACEMRKLSYMAGIIGPLLAIPIFLINPWLLAVIPGAAQNIFSTSTDTNIIGHHYSATFAAILLIANAYSLKRASLQSRKLIISAQLLAVLLLSVTYFPTLPYLWEGADPRITQLSQNLQVLEEIIPAQAALSAPPAVTAKFWNRPSLYYFPLHALDSDYIVMPKYLPGYPALTAKDLQDFDSSMRKNPDFSIIHENPDIRVFKRLEK